MSAPMNTNPEIPRANPMIWLASELVAMVDQGDDVDFYWAGQRLKEGLAIEILKKLPGNPLGIMETAEIALLNTAVEDFVGANGLTEKTGVSKSGALLLANVLLALAMQQTTSHPTT